MWCFSLDRGPLTTDRLWCKCPEACLSSSTVKRVFLLIGKLFALPVLPQFNWYGQTHWLAKTVSCCRFKEVLCPVYWSGYWSTILYSATVSWNFVEIQHFYHVVMNIQWILEMTHTYFFQDWTRTFWFSNLTGALNTCLTGFWFLNLTQVFVI